MPLDRPVQYFNRLADKIKFAVMEFTEPFQNIEQDGNIDPKLLNLDLKRTAFAFIRSCGIADDHTAFLVIDFWDEATNKLRKTALPVEHIHAVLELSLESLENSNPPTSKRLQVPMQIKGETVHKLEPLRDLKAKPGEVSNDYLFRYALPFIVGQGVQALWLHNQHEILR